MQRKTICESGNIREKTLIFEILEIDEDSVKVENSPI